MKPVKATLGSLVLLLLISSAPGTKAADTVINANTSPIKTGSGANLKGRFQNVTTVDGKNVDLLGEIISQSTTKTNDFWNGAPWALPGDFVFSFKDMVIGESRQAVVRWSFFEAETNIPIAVPQFSLTLDDLDKKYGGGSGRIETVSSTDAEGYTIDASSNLNANASGETISATGGANQNPGDPEGTIKLHFKSLTSFTMTYATEPQGADTSAFHHDGGNDFVFDDPEYKELSPRLYYTYNLTNDDGNPIEVGFFDDLPAGLIWDTSYTADSSNSLAAAVSYSNGNRDASIAGLSLPPGTSTFTLRSLRTDATGSIENEATVTPKDLTATEPLRANASITLSP